jgi:hypothetical protein
MEFSTWSRQRLVTAVLRPLGGELLIPSLVGSIGGQPRVNRVNAGRQPNAQQSVQGASVAPFRNKPGGSL